MRMSLMNQRVSRAQVPVNLDFDGAEQDGGVVSLGDAFSNALRPLPGNGDLFIESERAMYAGDSRLPTTVS